VWLTLKELYVLQINTTMQCMGDTLYYNNVLLAELMAQNKGY
jgi:hypothetical protein